MPYELSKDLSGKTLLIRDTMTGPVIVYPKFYSKWNPHNDDETKYSYFAKVDTGNDGWMSDRGWSCYMCLYTDDETTLPLTDGFRFKVGEYYNERCGVLYPVRKADANMRRTLEYCESL